jgi:hypothetical protein
MTKPDGKLKNMNVNIMGITNIIFACAGSPTVGVIFCCMNIEAPIKSGDI